MNFRQANIKGEPFFRERLSEYGSSAPFSVNNDESEFSVVPDSDEHSEQAALVETPPTRGMSPSPTKSSRRSKLVPTFSDNGRILAAPARTIRRAVRFLNTSKNKESAQSSDEGSNDPLLRNLEEGNLRDPEKRRRARELWQKLAKEVHYGKFLLQGAMRQKQSSAFAQERSTRIWEEMDPQEKERERAMAQSKIRRGVQFTVQHCVLAILLYVGVAIVAFSFVFSSQWTIIDSVYFAVVTFTTIGYGDIVPDDYASRAFTVAYAFSGVAFLGVALGVLGTNVVETQEAAVLKTSEIAKTRVMALFASPEEEDKLESEMEEQLQSDEHLQGRHDRKVGPMSQILITFAVVVLILFLFAVCIANDPGIDSSYDIVNAVYYTVMTACTIGYGDFAPQSQFGRLIAIIFIPIVVAAMGHLLSIVAFVMMESRRTSFQRQLECRELTVKDLELMDTDGNGEVSRAEFLEFMLVSMGKVDSAFIEEMRLYFAKLDTDQRGALSKSDLIANARRKLKRTSKKLQLGVYKRNLFRRAEEARQSHNRLRGSSFWGARMSFFNLFHNEEDLSD